MQIMVRRDAWDRALETANEITDRVLRVQMVSMLLVLRDHDERTRDQDKEVRVTTHTDVRQSQWNWQSVGGWAIAAVAIIALVAILFGRPASTQQKWSGNGDPARTDNQLDVE